MLHSAANRATIRGLPQPRRSGPDYELLSERQDGTGHRRRPRHRPRHRHTAGGRGRVGDAERSRDAALSETQQALTSAGQHDAAPLAGDLTEPSFPDALVAAALERFGALDIIVNNAGYSWDNVIQKTTDEQFQAMLDIHLVVPFRMMRAASAHIRTAGEERDRRAGGG